MRKSLSRAVVAVVLCCVVRVPAGAQAATAQTADPYAERLREFEAFVAGAMKADHIPGTHPMTDAGLEYIGAAVALHPENAKLRELLGDFLARKGKPDAAAESYRAAFTIDPGLAKGLSADEYVAQRLKAAAEQKKN